MSQKIYTVKSCLCVQGLMHLLQTVSTLWYSLLLLTWKWQNKRMLACYCHRLLFFSHTINVFCWQESLGIWLGKKTKSGFALSFSSSSRFSWTASAQQRSLLEAQLINPHWVSLFNTAVADWHISSRESREFWWALAGLNAPRGFHSSSSLNKTCLQDFLSVRCTGTTGD